MTAESTATEVAVRWWPQHQPTEEDRAVGEAAQAAHEPTRLLDELEQLVRAYVVLPVEEAYHAIALWVAHTYCWRSSHTTPYLNFTAPEKQSGKSRALEVLEMTVNRPLKAASVSPAAIYRAIEEWHPTFLIDEADTVFGGKGEDHAALRNILNDGYRSSGAALRVEGQNNQVRRFSTFCPKALAGIGDLPETLADRSIVIRMKRRRSDEPVLPFRQTRDRRAAADAFRERLAAAFGVLEDQLGDAEPDLPDELSDRQADCWEPLVAIADAAGGRWPSLARRAAVVLSEGAGAAEEASLRLRLLSEVREVFDAQGVDRLPTSTLVALLHAMEEAPWEAFGLDARKLAWHLRAYDVSSTTIRFADGPVAKGYYRADFEDAWARYL